MFRLGVLTRPSYGSALRFIYGRSCLAAAYSTAALDGRLFGAGATIRTCIVPVKVSIGPSLSSRRSITINSLTLSTSESDIGHNPEIDTLELVDIVKKGGVHLIDVREHHELEETGILSPNIINIPLDEVANALQLPPEQFQTIYRSPKPEPEDGIVFYCMAGVRSLSALETAQSLGYTKARHYIKGWLGWQIHLESEKN